jgi:hypothetical protein
MARVTLQRKPDGSYVSSDGRYIVTPDHDHEAVRRGRGPRIWWVQDTTGQQLPRTCQTLRDVRRQYLDGRP